MEERRQGTFFLRDLLRQSTDTTCVAAEEHYIASSAEAEKIKQSDAKAWKEAPRPAMEEQSKAHIAQQVEDDDILSYSMYCYRRSDGKISMLADGETID